MSRGIPRHALPHEPPRDPVMRPEFRQAFSDTALLWALLALVAVLDVLARIGMTIPLLERTTMWRMRGSPLVLLFVAGFATVAVLVLGSAGNRHRERGLFTAGMCAAFALMLCWSFDPALGGAFAATAGLLWRNHARRDATPRSAPSPRSRTA